jgi:hypothetical protein
VLTGGSIVRPSVAGPLVVLQGGDTGDRRSSKEVGMGFLDRLLGREPRTQHPQTYQPPYAAGAPRAPQGHGGAGEDERAIARYRYLLRTAPPEALEQVHADAFARLTPQQRSQVLGELSRGLPEGERPAGDDPQSLARTATRAELRQPGYLERTFSRTGFGGPGGTGMGMGGTILGSMMGTIAGVVVGSALADALFDGYADSPEASGANDTQGTDTGDAPEDQDTGSGDGGDSSGTDVAGGEVGDGSGFDGGDGAGGGWDGGGFGGGDFGGGDFGGGGF